MIVIRMASRYERTDVYNLEAVVNYHYTAQKNGNLVYNKMDKGNGIELSSVST
jgi:hypothetical protein